MTRACGACQLCCKLLPTPQLNKPAGQRCQYQRAGKGCTIYARRPSACRLWSCQWLANPDTADLRRPDRSHYVIDPMPDYVGIRNDDTGERQDIPVIQVWLDPDYPDAHRDPALRAWLERQRMPAIIRYDNRRAFTLWPPSVASDGQWHEIHANVDPEKTHSALDVFRVLAEASAREQ